MGGEVSEQRFGGGMHGEKADFNLLAVRDLLKVVNVIDLVASFEQSALLREGWAEGTRDLRNGIHLLKEVRAFITLPEHFPIDDVIFVLNLFEQGDDPCTGRSDRVEQRPRWQGTGLWSIDQMKCAHRRLKIEGTGTHRMPRPKDFGMMGNGTRELIEGRKGIPLVIEIGDKLLDALNPVAQRRGRRGGNGIIRLGEFMPFHFSVEELDQQKRAFDLGGITNETRQIVFEILEFIEKKDEAPEIVKHAHQVDRAFTIKNALISFLHRHDK